MACRRAAVHNLASLCCIFTLGFLALQPSCADRAGVSNNDGGADDQDPQPRPHLLDPLSADEIHAVRDVIKGDPRWSPEMTFQLVTLNEPEKKTVLSWNDEGPPYREALAVMFDRVANATWEVVVATRERTILHWNGIPGAQPILSPEDIKMAQEIVLANPAWQALATKRGMKGLENAHIDVWSYGGTTPGGARLLRTLTFSRDDVRNPYSRPVEGLIAVVNMNTREIVHVEDTGKTPIPPGADINEDRIPALREAPKPLTMEQPEGPSYEARGHLVRWQKWQFRWSMLPRDGLVLYQVGYEDDGEVRSILYKGNLAEVAVPYGDPDPSWSFREALDEGEYNIGVLASSLTPDKDVPGYATLFDATFAAADGTPYVTPRAVALYEVDDGTSWTHHDNAGRFSEVRRGRKLVLQYSPTIANYDYELKWIFHQDGTLEVTVDMTGIMLAKGADASPYGTKVAPGVIATNHQHLFSYRLDMDVDGVENDVYETCLKALPAGPENPEGNAFVTEDMALSSETGRDLEHAAMTTWKVSNASATNRLGQKTSYMLRPAMDHPIMAQPGSKMRQRAAFAEHALWVTRYEREENHASGAYVVQSDKSTGLPGYAGGESTVHADVVLWYTLGHTHIPRPEEWPVMPRAGIGFKLMPSGFFHQNPALDLPDTPPATNP
jgi:primary-amine oxidase